MDLNENIHELLIVNKKQFYNIYFINCAIYLVILLLLEFPLHNIFNITRTIICLISIISLLLINLVYFGQEKSYLKVLMFFYGNFAFEYIREMIVFRSQILNSILGYSPLLGQSFSYCLLAVTFYLENGDKFFTKKHNLIRTVIVVIFIFSNYFFDKVHYSSLLPIIFGMIAIIVSLLNSKNYKNKDSDKANLFTLSFIYMVFYEIILIIHTYSLISENLVFFITSSCFVLLYATESIIVVYRILKSPYKFIFMELYKKNDNLEKLNKTIVSKNRELELSHERIKRNEDRYKNFFNNIQVPLVLVSKDKKRILFANKLFLDLICVTNLKEVMNKKIFSFFDDYETLNKPENEDSNEYLRCSRKVNGEKLSLDVSIIHSSDKPKELIMTIEDVTQKVRVEKLREMVQNRSLEEKIKTNFLSNISHDLKTPINVIYSLSQLIPMFSESKNIDQIKKYYKIAKQNCVSLTRFTNNLIDGSKMKSDYLSAHPIKCNIVEVVEDVVTGLVEYAKNKDIDIIFDTDEEEIYLMVDQEFIQRIIINLISNSIKFIDKKGKIEVNVLSSDTDVKVIVKDNGMGMKESFIEKSFSRYLMGDNNDEIEDKGTGIGLFVVKKMVEELNGDINISSVINEGTTIVIILKKEKNNGCTEHKI